MAKKVLIIDDSPTAVDLMERLLKEEGYEVITSLSGEDGVKKAKLKNPDLVIIDTLMPDIDGFEACRQIRQACGPGKPNIIIITGSVDAIDALRARRMGADDYVVKSSNFSYLMGAVKNWTTINGDRDEG